MTNKEDLVLAAIRASAIIGTDSKLTAMGGTRIIDTTTPTLVEAQSIMAQTATVISVCTGINMTTGALIDFVATYNWVTISAGIPIIAPNDCRIKNITLMSGSIAVYS